MSREQEWQDDSTSNHCLVCRSEFNFFNRRHHCRQCGILCCASCSSKTSQFWDEKKRWTSAQRVCDACARRRETEVAVGTGNKIDPISGSNSLPSQNVTIVIVIRAARELTYARQSGSLWVDRGSRSLNCSLSVGG